MRTEKFSKKDGFSVTFPALLFCATLVSGFLLVRFLEGIGTEHLTTQGQNALTAMVKGVENEFHSSSAAVTAMSGSPWILPALSSPDPENFDKAYSVLARYNDSIGFSVCYLLDSKGAVIVSSNRNMPDSFVGKNYSFRPYFQEAISGKPAVYLATGITSLERGFYAAHPVRDSEGYIRGVVAIKTNVDAMKQILKAYPTSFFVNPDGVIFMSGSPEMVFQSLWPVPPDRGRELKDSKQFGRDSFQPVFGRPLRQGDRVRFRGEKHFCLRTSLGLPGWSLVLLVPMKEVTYFGFLGWVVTGFAAGMIIVLTFWALARERTLKLLRNSEASFRALYESSKDAIMTLSPAEGFLSGNDSTLKLFGCSGEADFIGRRPDDFSPQYQPDGQLSSVKAGQMMKLALERGAHFFEWKHKRVGGEEFFSTVLLARVVLGNKTILQATVRDISEMTKLRMELERKVDFLERFQRVAVDRELKMKELKAKIAELEARNNKS